MKSYTHSLFGQPITFFTLSLNNEKIISFLKENEWNLTYSSLNKNGKNSFATKDINILEKKELTELKKECLKHINHYVNEVFEYKIKCKIINSWGTKTLKDGYSHAHHHAHSLFSGVYYPEYHEGFKIRFYKTITNSFWCLPIKRYNTFNSQNWFFVPEKNNLLIFPSELTHQIEKNTSNKIRYSIAFNVNPTGIIGEHDNQVIFS